MTDHQNRSAESAGLVIRLRDHVGDDHVRGCAGRQYYCDCGHDQVTEGLLEMAADEIERLHGLTTGVAQAAREPEAWTRQRVENYFEDYTWWDNDLLSSTREQIVNDIVAMIRAQPPAAPVETPPRAWLEAKAEVDAGWPERCSAETVEEIAKWLHDETGHPDSYPDHTWPETERDDGRRESGWVKIVPQHAQAYFRDIARRMAARFPLNEPQTAGMRDTMIRGMQAAFDEVAEYLEQQNAGGFAAHIRRRSVSLSRPNCGSGK